MIERERTMRGMSQAELALLVGMTQGDVSVIESGKTSAPSYDRMIRFSKFLNIPVAELIKVTGWAGAPVSKTAPPVDEAWKVGSEPAAELSELVEKLGHNDVVLLVRLARVLLVGKDSE